jgi:hypothetical protein
MLRIGKTALVLLSWAPLAWTLTALLAARFNLYSLKEVIVLSVMCYILGGFVLWLFLNAVFTWQKVISKQQCIRYCLLTAIGLLCACLTWHYDVFGLVGSYID